MVINGLETKNTLIFMSNFGKELSFSGIIKNDNSLQKYIFEKDYID